MNEYCINIGFLSKAQARKKYYREISADVFPFR